MIKGKSDTKYYLKNANNPKIPQKARTKKNSTSKNFKLNNYNSANLDHAIHEINRKFKNKSSIIKRKIGAKKKSIN